MNRLSPLIVRRTGRAAAARIALPTPPLTPEQTSELNENLKRFASGWLGGLIFFGTYLA